MPPGKAAKPLELVAPVFGSIHCVVPNYFNLPPSSIPRDLIPSASNWVIPRNISNSFHSTSGVDATLPDIHPESHWDLNYC